MLEFTLLVIPTEINASETVKSVKSASICLDCINLCNKILSTLGHAVVVEGHHPGTDFAWYPLEFEGNQVGIIHCLSAFDALVLACRISSVYHGICGRITMVYIRFKLPVEELFSLDYLYNVERQGNPRLLHTILFFCSYWTTLEFKGRQPKESV